MALFTIGDLHLSFGCDKPMDVFPGWKDYTARLEQNWRAMVSDQDTVVIAGDISWAMKLGETEADFSFLESLPGKKWLLKGNHDYWWTTRKKIEAYFKEKGFSSLGILFNSAETVGDVSICGTRGWFYDAESDADKKILNREVGRLNTSIALAKATGKEPVVFLHYPPVYGGMECQEILQVLLEQDIKQCYYGHIHGGFAAQKAVTGYYKGIDLHLISCDFTGFRPVSIQ